MGVGAGVVEIRLRGVGGQAEGAKAGFWTCAMTLAENILGCMKRRCPYENFQCKRECILLEISLTFYPRVVLPMLECFEDVC